MSSDLTPLALELDLWGVPVGALVTERPGGFWHQIPC